VWHSIFLYIKSVGIINCVSFGDFLQLCKYFVEVICTKVQERTNLKAHFELGNDLMKICFKQKNKNESCL
jgi:hypothetical protein